MQKGHPPWLILAAVVAFALASFGCASIPAGRSAIDSVELEGTSGVSSDDVEEKLATTKSPKFLALFRGVVFDYEIYDRFVLQRDLARVERYYRARGYYEAQARAARVTQTKSNHVAVTIEVYEGKPVNIGVIDIAGLAGLPRKVAAKARAAVSDRLKKGEAFDEDNLTAAELALKRALTDQGYAYAHVKRFASVDLPRHVADIGFGVVAGPTARIGKITIEGLESLPEGPVRRALDLTEGESYSTQKLDDAQQALLDLGVFGAVDITPELIEPPPPDPIVNLHVKVETTRLRSVRLGGGAEIDVIKSDVHLTAGWEDRNFLGGLRRFRVEVKPGLVLYPTRLPDFQAPKRLLPAERSRIELHQPGLFEARTNGVLRTEFNIYPVLLTPQVNTGDPVLGYRELKGAAGADRSFWKLFAAATYNIQLNFPFTYFGPLDPTLRSVVISYFDLLTNLDFRDNRVHPHKGLYLGNDLQIAGGIFGGDANDIKIQPEARAYVPLGKKVVFAARASAGLLFPLNYGDTLQTDTASGQVPPGVDKAQWSRDVQLVYFRSFFGGGPSSNRGWPLQGIGPHGIAPFFSPTLAASQIAQECDPQNPSFDPVRCAVPLGGLTLWEASTEVRIPLLSALEGATFCDAADVSAKHVDFRFGARRLHLSCGLGLRYDTPVGPIRLDVAYRIPGVNPSDDDIRNGLDGNPGTIFGVPLAIAFGIGEAF